MDDSRQKTLLPVAEALLAEWATATATPTPNRLDVSLVANDLVAAVEALVGAQWGYLAAITGLDLGVEAGELEALYHFCAGADVVTLRVRVARDAAVVPSICAIIPSASFFERELMEMLGITVGGTPNTDRLFLPDEWPDGVYPLRKDFQPGVKRKT
ncbi:MAG TPA: NADH-quinone oxidoreductase subunit C [Anaerolineae bacterium]